MGGCPKLFCLHGANPDMVIDSNSIFFTDCDVCYVLSCLGLLSPNGRSNLDRKQ
jgi:hypothetical protein